VPTISSDERAAGGVRAEPRPAPAAEAAWDVLERFGQALQQCAQSAQQVRLALSTVQEALAADVVFWYPGGSGEEPEAVGPAGVPAAWCREFAERALQGAPANSGQVLCSFLDPAAKPASPWPCSAALVRMSRSRNTWLGAASIHPRRLFSSADIKVMRLARRMVLNHRRQAQVYDKLRDSLLGLVRCLTAAIDAKDPYTWGHSERVARIAVGIAHQLGLAAEARSDLYLAGLLHDVGKIGVPDSVLQKAGPLSEEEFAYIRAHPVIGDRLVANVHALNHLRPGVRHHHERWDGKGYPDGLAGEDVPLQARVLAVADSCDAMMSARPYRSALPPVRIDAIMLEGAGSQWDPRVVEAFLACRHELYAICERGLGDSVLAAVERVLNASGAAEPSSRLRSAAGPRT
jgi:HD-GYP domain-containing protein (c-di-GMP phosphodiesterase class II)